jgi:hypothetical protein
MIYLLNVKPANLDQKHPEAVRLLSQLHPVQTQRYFAQPFSSSC